MISYRIFANHSFRHVTQIGVPSSLGLLVVAITLLGASCATEPLTAGSQGELAEISSNVVSGSTIVSVAQGELGNSARNTENPAGSNCNYYSGYWGDGSSLGCASTFRSTAWCAEFARYVWKTAGVADLKGLNAWAYSFAQYGKNHGTFHSPSGYTPAPGDAVVFDGDSLYIDVANTDLLVGDGSGGVLGQDIDHVALVESYSCGGTVTYIGGNQGGGVISRSTVSISSSNVRGFITPSGLTGGAGTLASPILGYDQGGGTGVMYRWASSANSFPSYSTATWSGLDMTKVGGRMASGDVNGDGKEDTVMAYQNTDGTFSLKVLLNGTASPVGTPPVPVSRVTPP
jgi:hypothetical protein